MCWTCRLCGTVNSATHEKCRKCGCGWNGDVSPLNLDDDWPGDDWRALFDRLLLRKTEAEATNAKGGQMFNYLSNRTDVINLGQQQPLDGASYVVFKRDDGTEFTIDVKAFQTLRRGLHFELNNVTTQAENKIALIKALRGLTGFGLYDAKNVVEYFLANYTLNAGKGNF